MRIESTVFGWVPTRESVMVESVSLLHWNRTILAAQLESNVSHTNEIKLNLFRIKSCNEYVHYSFMQIIHETMINIHCSANIYIAPSIRIQI